MDEQELSVGVFDATILFDSFTHILTSVLPIFYI
jgi:hypothetical protein